MSKTLLFNKLRDLSDSFKTDVRNLRSVYQDSSENLKRDYIGQKLRDEANKLDNEYKNSVKGRRAKFGSDYLRLIRDARKVEQGKLHSNGYSADTAIKFLNLLMDSGIPVGKYEFAELYKTYHASYWGCQVLRQIARKNDIALEDIEDVELEPSLDERMVILNEAERLCDNLRQNFRGDGELDDMRMLTDSEIGDLENAWLAGMTAEKNLPTDALVRRSFTKVRQTFNSLEMGNAIISELRSLPESCHDDFLRMVYECDAVSDNALQYAGILEQANAYRSGELPKAYKSAVDAVERIKQATSDYERHSIAGENRHNPYIVSELRKNGFDDVADVTQGVLAEEQGK